MIAISPLVLALAVASTCLTACDAGRGSQERSANTFAHLDGIRVDVSDSDQPFEYAFSVIGLAALGKHVRSALATVGYERSRALWDDGFDATVQGAASDDFSLIGLSAAASTQAASGGTFLSASQENAIKAYVDRVLEGKLRLPVVKHPADREGVGEKPSVTSAAMLESIVTSLLYRQQETHRFLTQVRAFDEGAVGCTPANWRSEEGGAVVELVRASLEIRCSPEEIRAAWQGVVDDLEGSDLASGFDSGRLDLLRIAIVVSDRLPKLFTAADRERVQEIIDEALPQLSDDPYVWLYFYAMFTGPSATTYHAEVTKAATAILLYTASHGAVPDLEIHR